MATLCDGCTTAAPLYRRVVGGMVAMLGRTFGEPVASGPRQVDLETLTRRYERVVSDSDEPVTGEPHKTKDSVYDGESIERYDNGVIYMRGDVRSGLRHGEWLTFYRDGNVWSKGTYINGYREGYGVSYHPNGNKSSEGYYKHDRPVGPWKYWSEDGTLTEHDFKGDTTGTPGK